MHDPDRLGLTGSHRSLCRITLEKGEEGRLSEPSSPVRRGYAPPAMVFWYVIFPPSTLARPMMAESVSPWSLKLHVPPRRLTKPSVAKRLSRILPRSFSATRSIAWTTATVVSYEYTAYASGACPRIAVIRFT